MKSLLKLPSKEFIDFIGSVQDYQQTSRLGCTFFYNRIPCFCSVSLQPWNIIAEIKPISSEDSIGTGCGNTLVKFFKRDDTAGARLQLTADQIDAVVEWMNTWEQLKNTAIPMRFKGDFTKGLQRDNPS